MKKTVLLTLLTTLTFSLLSFAGGENTSKQELCEANGISYSLAQKFVRDMKSAVSYNNIKGVIRLTSFPLTVNETNAQGHRTLLIQSNGDLKKQYNQIFTAEVKEAIAKASSTTIDCNAQGAMVGNGVLWFKTLPIGARFFVVNH